MAVSTIVFGGLWVLGGFENDGSSMLQNEQPDLRVEKDRKPRIKNFLMPTGYFDECVKATNVGRSNITIRNVLINDKEHWAKLGDVSKFDRP